MTGRYIRMKIKLRKKTREKLLVPVPALTMALTAMCGAAFAEEGLSGTITCVRLPGFYS
jgi:hypothetical protein